MHANTTEFNLSAITVIPPSTSIENKVVVKYQCGACDNLHDYEYQAEECCQPDVSAVYICPTCDADHETKEDANDCISSHVLVGSDLTDTCPNCLRNLESLQSKIEVTIGGHCSACNPIFSPEHNISIKYACEPDNILG